MYLSIPIKEEYIIVWALFDNKRKWKTMSSLTKDIQILLKFENDMFFPELKRDKLYKLSH